MANTQKVLILFAHPNRDQSRVQNTLVKAVEHLDGVTVVDLYDEYPNFLIDVKREQKRIQEHSLLIFQHPIYWYSCPPLLKEWMDCVLELGWAYGDGGDKMVGLDFLQVLSSGGPDEAYVRSGYNRFTIPELLRPFEATANLCGWRYHKPFLIQGVKSLTQTMIDDHAERYRQLLKLYLERGRAVLDAMDTSIDRITYEPI